MKDEYERSLRKFEGLVKKQEQLLRGRYGLIQAPMSAEHGIFPAHKC